MKSFFPIKTATACQLKWTWSSIYLYTGLTNSCHRVDLDPVPGDFNFHNTAKKISDRKIMLDGGWPTGGCEYCQKIEQAGGFSDRLLHLSIPDLAPAELEHDTSAVNVTPRIVEVYFDNICNLSCVYCQDKYSSRIQQENVRFGRFEKNGLVIDNSSRKQSNFNEMTEKFWSWFEQNLSSIRRFHLLGGEPFYQRQFEHCLDFFDNHAAPELEFNIVSNLMIDNHKLHAYIARLKALVARRQIKRFEITCSIDCWGAEQEYVRWGLDLSTWSRNFEYLAAQKWLTLHINQVVSALTIPSMPSLLSYVNGLTADRAIGHHLILCVEPDYMNPEVFGAGFFDRYFDEILELMPEDTWAQQSAKKYMSGVKARIDRSVQNRDLLIKLRTYLDEIDRRRGCDWKKTFPWSIGVLDVV